MAEQKKVVKEETKTASGLIEEMCKAHKRKVELIDIEDRCRICTHCALFGKHKNHDIREETDVMNEITLRTELLIQLYQLIQESSQNRIIQTEVSQLAEIFNN